MTEQTPMDETVNAAEPSQTQPAPAEQTIERTSYPFAFHGQGGEFFKIWIVNIVLTILTLGIYAAWAKVRTHQYFYGNTEVAKASFQYLADPITILKGRIIAVVLFLAYFFLNQQFPVQTMLVSIPLFIIAAPWIINRSLRFNMRNTAYRNIRFDFTGTYGSAFCNFVLGYLAVIFSFGMAFPWWLRQLNKYVVNNTKYGDAEFEATLDVGEYYIAFLLSILISFAVYAVILIGIGISAIGAAVESPVLTVILGGVTGIAGIIGFSFAKAFVNARLGNLLFNNTKLRDNGFTSELKPVDLTKLYVTNALLIIVTLGLAIPWVMVRMARYRLETLTLEATDLTGFVSEQTDRGNAIGEEIGDVFDIELGL
ncbi:YjgN family protein [Corallincola platygyrae]|uniref:YjgN family protein n=1 Tax=Corallincola platygyrae TaxID=1193278 RepID=A0ABW4XQ89_9GAMM